MENNNVKKSNKGVIILIVILILIVLGLSGYIVYDKFITKEEEKETKINTTQDTNDEIKINKKEYISLDLNEYLKINEDNTYNLKYKKNQNYIEVNGKYTKIDENNYKLEDGNNVIITGEVLEIENILSDEYFKGNLILFDKNSIDSVHKKINTSVENYIKEQSNLWKKDRPQIADMEKVEVKVDSCMRYAFNDEEIKKDGIVCSLGTNIYLKDYDYNVCNNEMEDSSNPNNKYIDYIIPAGECGYTYVSTGKYFSLNHNDNYNVLGTFTGL